MKIIIFFLAASVLVASAQQMTRESENTADASHVSLLGYFARGKPIDNIEVGILKNSSQSNIFVCLFSIGQTNSHQLWIAPPQFQRVDYFLYDSSHKAVPYSATYNPPNKNYKNIFEVPKDFRNVHIGTMWPPFTMPYDQIALTNVFQIAHGGDYRILAKGRIMKINGDGSLSLVEFPPASLMIHLSDEDIVTKSN